MYELGIQHHLNKDKNEVSEDKWLNYYINVWMNVCENKQHPISNSFLVKKENSIVMVPHEGDMLNSER